MEKEARPYRPLLADYHRDNIFHRACSRSHFTQVAGGCHLAVHVE